MSRLQQSKPPLIPDTDHSYIACRFFAQGGLPDLLESFIPLISEDGKLLDDRHDGPHALFEFMSCFYWANKHQRVYDLFEDARDNHKILATTKSWNLALRVLDRHGM
eukprot:TRINITY_DN41264_c0_g1_i1.p1 TRINITY_DN41264_c0_g1~~TRINITY_DN41264_c0_g1_i1.p1  ORF type:complete len:107 (+),score=12.79 TRINITY_DN41264_c0_g1_i1:206-526(+)